MIQPRLIWELARKDLLLFLTDRRGMLLCFGVPILLASVFGAIFYRQDDQSLRPRVLLTDTDGSPMSRLVLEALRNSEQIEAEICDASMARRRFSSENFAVLVTLPPGLGNLSIKQLSQQAERPRVELLHHPRFHWEARWVEGVLTETILREAAKHWLAPLLAGGETGKLERPFGIDRKAEPAGGALSAHAFSHSFCGMTLQYLLFWGMDSGLVLLRERRQGLWRRLRAAPVTRLTLLMGKVLSTSLIALGQIAFTFVFGWLVFGVTINGSMLGFALMALSAALLSGATGLLVAAMGGNESRARSLAILVILTLSLLGGLWLPSFLLPSWAQSLALALPTTWAARGLEGVTWQGMDVIGAIPCALILIGFSVLFLTVAWWRLVRSDGGVPCSA